MRGAVALARDLGLSAFIIGLTIVAYGTSSPELVISIQAALDGHPDIALGNVIGSNISNILCVLGLTALIYPIAINKKESGFDGLMMLLVATALLVFGLFGEVGYLAGGTFLLVLVVYTIFIFKNASKRDHPAVESHTEEIEDQIKVHLNIWQAGLACLIGMILLMTGGSFLVEGAVALAIIAGLPESVIGVTIVAFGGSVPELVTSVIAAFHKKSDIALGNIIGSNLFNILGILGITGFIAPIAVEDKFAHIDMPIMVAVTAALFALIYFRPKISRGTGGVFFIGYAGYIGMQFL